MKTLDKYILFRFLYNFTSAFIILMVIFIFQAIWLFIDDFAGKDIDFFIVGKFLLYFSPSLIPTVLPLTVLFASILTFGTLAENYEFAAMKASGISLFRAMKSLVIFITFLSIGTFFFANNVIPAAEVKSYNLRRNIKHMNPALAITEGVFSPIGDEVNMKVGKKYGDNGQHLDNVMIHQLTKNINNKVIKSSQGELIGSTDSNILQLKLKNGSYYEDIKSNKRSKNNNYPHVKAYYDSYTMFIDLSKFNEVDLEKEKFKNTFKMLKINELNYAIDSLKKDNLKIFTNIGENIYKRTGIINLYKHSNKTTKRKTKKEPSKLAIKEFKDVSKNIDSMVLLLGDDYKKYKIIDLAINTVKNTKESLKKKTRNLNLRVKLYNHHILSLHQKYALAFACFILFFVGAPLGAIIKKGGLGLPFVFAIILFLIYHFIGIFARNFSEDGSISPIIGSWMSTFVMLPLGIYLTNRATTDKSVFEFSNPLENIRYLFKKASYGNSSKDISK